MLALLATRELYPCKPLTDIVMVKQEETKFLINLEPMVLTCVEPDARYLSELFKLLNIENKFETYR